MSNVYPLKVDPGKYRAVSEWISKMDRGLTANEETELRAWLADNPRNRALFLEAAEQWDRFNDLSRLSELFPAPEAHRRNSFRVFGYATVATVILAVLSGVLFFFQEERSSAGAGQTVTEYLPTVYETAVGEQSSVSLADGSRVTLNTNSRLEVRYSDFHRILTLVRGELHVDVVSDPDRPLTVFAGDKMVQAVGTSFGVEMRPDEDIEVLVTEGRVLVSARPVASSSSTVSQAPVLPLSSLTVAQGEEARMRQGGSPEVRRVTGEELHARLAWRQGDLVFRGELLADAMAEIGRYTTVEFVFLDNQLREERIVGRFKAGDVDGLLAVLRENLDITYERTAGGRVLLGSL